MAPLEPILFVPDAHRPFVHHGAWALMLQVGRWLKPKHLIVLGDFADFYAVSSHSKDPARAQCLLEEVEDVRKGLDELDELGAGDKRFCAGNHCDRLTRYLQDKAPELFGLVGIPELLGLRERGWQYIPYKDDTKLGKLWMTHDVGCAGRYAAHKALDTYCHPIVTGHTHRLSYVVEGNATGETMVSAMFGWLGDRDKADYMHRVKARKDWALGFGIGYLEPASGIVYLQPVPIVQDKGGKLSCVVNGKLFKGATK